MKVRRLQDGKVARWKRIARLQHSWINMEKGCMMDSGRLQNSKDNYTLQFNSDLVPGLVPSWTNQQSQEKE